MTDTGLSEFGRIKQFFAPLAGPGGLGLVDDAALVDCAPGHRLVVTVDAIVEGVHYLSEDPPDLVARKLLRVNLSDLAAMGARPLHYLLATALPGGHGDDWVAQFAAGLAEDQARFGVDLLGGNSVATSGPAVLSLTAIGEVAVGAEIRRSGAHPGDRIWVSGTIGDAFLGLQALRGRYPALAAGDRATLIQRFQLPAPRTELGPRLVGIAHAMLDISDELWPISGISARPRRLPPRSRSDRCRSPPPRGGRLRATRICRRALPPRAMITSCCSPRRPQPARRSTASRRNSGSRSPRSG